MEAKLQIHQRMQTSLYFEGIGAWLWTREMQNEYISRHFPDL